MPKYGFLSIILVCSLQWNKSLGIFVTMAAEQQKFGSPLIGSRRTWFLWFTGWSLFGLVMAIQSYMLLLRAGHTTSFALSLERELVYAYLWAVLTPYILQLARRFPLGPNLWIKNGTFHLFMGLAISIFHKFSYHVISMALEASAEHPFSFAKISAVVFSYIDYGALIYCTLLFIDFSVVYYRESREQALRSARLETELTRANLQALKMQIRPHFLFNSLNAVSVLIDKNPGAARQMLLRLSELLRMTLDREHTEEVTLAQELEFIDMYLQIEKTRFEDRLIIRRSIDETTGEAFVPSMILQPLVENSMRHGAAMQRGVTTIEIAAERQNGVLSVHIRDNGPGSANGKTEEGIGFSNIRSRLEQLYGTEQRFETANIQGGGFEATIILPFHTAPSQLQ